MRPLLASLILIALLPGVTDTKATEKRPPVSHRSGVEPSETGECPTEHPLKGNFTTRRGERCIYHMPGQRWYQRTKAERCYATEAEAVEDGCRRSKV